MDPPEQPVGCLGVATTPCQQQAGGSWLGCSWDPPAHPRPKSPRGVVVLVGPSCPATHYTGAAMLVGFMVRMLAAHPRVPVPPVSLPVPPEVGSPLFFFCFLTIL